LGAAVRLCSKGIYWVLTPFTRAINVDDGKWGKRYGSKEGHWGTGGSCVPPPL